MIRRFFIRRLRSVCLLILVPVLILETLNIISTYRNTEKELIVQEENTINRINDTIENTVNSVIKQQDNLLSSGSCLLYLKRILKNETIDIKGHVYINALLSMLQNHQTSTPYLESIYLYLDGAEKMISSDANGTVSFIDNYYDTEWLTYYGEMDESENILVTSRSVTKNSFSDPVDVTSVFYRMSYASGVIVLNLNTEIFENLLSSWSDGDYQTCALISAVDGEVLLSTEEYSSAILEEQIWGEITSEMNAQGSYRNNQSWVRIDGSSYLVTVQEVKGLPCYQVLLTPREYLYQAIGTQIFGMLLTMLVLLIAVIALSYRMTKRSFGYIEDCINVFSAAEDGEDVQMPKPDIEDEYTLLLSNVINMYLDNSQTQKKLMQEHYQNEMTEMRALQLQINPHFISNTLQTMDMEVLKEVGSESVLHSLMTKFDSMIRYIFRDPMSKVTVKEEWDYLKNYCEIMEIRFPGQNIVYYEIDEETLSLPVFRLMFQPIVENSFQHGKRGDGSKLYVKIRAAVFHGIFQVSVIDNGKGMTKEIQEKVRMSFQSNQSTNIGLTNLNRRLVIRYGKESSLKILSRVGEGTVISFEIPVEKLENTEFSVD